MEAVDTSTGPPGADLREPEPSPRTRFRVRAGRVYELRLLLQGPRGRGLSFGPVRPVFRDADGAELDPRLYGGSPAILHAQRHLVEILPGIGDDEVLMAAGESSRFLLAPPDAVELTLEGFARSCTLQSSRLRPMGILWSSAQATRLKSDHAKIAAERRRLLTERFQMAPPDLDHLEASLDMPVRQVEALQAHFARSGDWAPVLAAMTGDDEQAACRARLARSRSRRTRDRHVGFIGSERGYERLSAMARVTWLRQDRLEQQMAWLSLDLVIVESAPISGVEAQDEEWVLAFSSLDGTLPAAGRRLFETARARGIPVHFWITRRPSHAGLYLGAMREADRVISDGRVDPSFEGHVDHVIPRSTEPAACCPPARRFMHRNLTLVPVGCDAFDCLEFADLLNSPLLHDTLVTDFDHGTGSAALLGSFGKASPKVVGPHSRSTQRTLLGTATIVLLSRLTARDGADLEAIALDAIASGAIPVVFGHSGTTGSILDRLDRVFSAHDLVELQALYRVDWFRERRWRALFRAVMRGHVLHHRERGLLLGRDPFPAETDAPTVSAILVTGRPEAIRRGLENFRRQSWEGKDLTIIATTGDPVPDLDLAEDERLFVMPASATLGECLTYAISRVEGRYWAQFAEDCTYSEHHMEDLVHHFRASQSDAIGCLAATLFDAEANRSIGFPGVGASTPRAPGLPHMPKAALAGDRASRIPYASLSTIHGLQGVGIPDLEDAPVDIVLVAGGSIVTLDEGIGGTVLPAELSSRSIQVLTHGNILRRLDHDG